MEDSFNFLQTLDGKAWSKENFSGKVTVLSFTDQNSQALSTQAGIALGKRFMEHPRFQIATAVKVPSMFKGLAAALLKAGQVKAREGAAKGFSKAGKPVPEDLDQRVHVLFDLDGKAAGALLSGWKSNHAQLLLVDGAGAVHGEFSDPDPENAVEALSEQLTSLLSAG